MISAFLEYQSTGGYVGGSRRPAVFPTRTWRPEDDLLRK